jgi:hypothetical protein
MFPDVIVPDAGPPHARMSVDATSVMRATTAAIVILQSYLVNGHNRPLNENAARGGR